MNAPFYAYTVFHAEKPNQCLPFTSQRKLFGFIPSTKSDSLTQMLCFSPNDFNIPESLNVSRLQMKEQ